MEKIDLNNQWSCYRLNHKEEAIPVSIPHDAMLNDKRSNDSVSGINLGWYMADDYVYEREIFIPESYKEKKIFLEFEGVYHNAEIYINDKVVTFHDYGYTGFYVALDNHVSYQKVNTIKVITKNSDQPNSRWYSGTGIYRPVWLCLLPKKHIIPDSLRVTTLDFASPRIRIEAKTNEKGLLKIEILDGKEVLFTEEHKINDSCTQIINLPGAKCWDAMNPNLYLCRVTFCEDVCETMFGIRVIECTSDDGFMINGKREVLKGACIHHDNGLLGACAYDFAEERKVRIIKECGYNAIRSAHNPCSKALLRACDRLGMYVMDEYVDVWYIHKTKYDYAGMVEVNFKRDLKDIVNKDYNHPSVIMYSTGNEVSETAQKKGIELCKKMTSYLHELDSTRPVTCGVNIFFNFLSSMGLGVYSDKKSEESAKVNQKKKAVGSEFFNNLAGIFGAGFMKFGASLYPCDIKTRDAFSNMDIAGYNYGILRYKHDIKKYPDRIILGSETFCNDAFKFWELAKKHPRLIGDFVWSGMDYLGEVGIGSWEYKEYAPDFSHGNGWLSAGSGRIDLTGKPLAEMAYTRVAFELDKIRIGVIPVDNATKPHSPSAWKMTNAIESWSWNGLHGAMTRVEVYARASKVELYVNGKCIGKKKPKNDCRVIFKARYQDGEVKAVAYDKNEKIIAEAFLKTAGSETILTMCPEQRTIHEKSDLCYVRLQLTDNQGIIKPLERGNIKITAEGGTLLACGSACPYNEKGFTTNETDTYYGEALAIIKPIQKGILKIKATCKYGKCEAEINVV